MRFLYTVILIAAAAGNAFGQGSEYPAMKYRSNYLASYYLSHGPNTTPWWPAWSPDGKWIAVAMYGSIWKVDPKTGVAEELTYNKKLHSQPAWSPDGKFIIYTADDNWNSIQLEVLNVATGAAHPLTTDNHVYVDPVFSPDGKRVAYVTSNPSGFLNVNVRAIQGGDWSGPPMEITADHRFGKPRLYFADNDFHTQPAWKKDGSGMLLVSNRDVPLGSGKLWSIPVAANAMEKARVILDEQSLYRTRPDISPDGSRVVYSSTAGAADQFNHLYVLPVEGGQPYKLTFGNYDNFHPRWSPDGEWIAYISNEGGLPQLWLLEVHGGEKRKIAIKELKWKRPMGKVRVSIIDAATGKPTVARVTGEASDGKLYAPTDSYVFNARLATGLRRIFFSKGEYTVAAPPGRMTVEVHKGFDYWPTKAEVDVKAGQAQTLTLTLKPHVDLRPKGWYNASTHVHMNYGGNLQNSPEDLLLIAAAQGMQIVSSLAACKDNRVLDWQYFKPGGREHPASKLTGDPPARQLLVFGEENRPPFWGHTFYIGLRDHLISPFLTGYEGTGLNSLWPTNTDLFKKARAQGAATGYVHAFGGESDPLGGKGVGGAKGYGVDVALGTIDALEWSAASRGSLIPVMHAWNNDFPIAPVGGEDSLANMQDNRPIGIIRTYAYLGNSLTHDGWVNAIKKGHTIVSSGPVVEFTVNGQKPGDSVRLASAGAVSLQGQVWSSTPIRFVRVYQNGKPWKDMPVPAKATDFKFSERTTVSSSGWFSLVVEADEQPPAGEKYYAQALTNRVAVYVGDQKIRNRASAEYFIEWVNRLRNEISEGKLWRTEAERNRAFAQLDEALAVYRARAAEAAQ
ncbi:MAG: CehA/McbA family metallohydrolase [Bryobacterales bacterium]|nr:CehA/McbA family metallohydrolase [Bryobacterales bacterium]